MANVINEFLVSELQGEIKKAGSCLLVGFQKMSVAQAEDIRREFRKAGLKYRVVKNRLASVAFAAHKLDVGKNLKGKCGVVFAPQERAIEAAKLLRDHYKKLKVKEPPLSVIGGVIEGEVIGKARAAAIVDMPDRKTVQAQLASVLAAPMRSLAVALSGVAGGVSRCIQARVDSQPGAAGGAAAKPEGGAPA
jgi:large subunit ribosomal protein L10